MNEYIENFSDLDLSQQLGYFAVLDYEMNHYHDYSWTQISGEEVQAYSASGYLKRAIEEKLVLDADLLSTINFWIDRRREAEPLAIKLIQKCIGTSIKERQIIRLQRSELSIFMSEFIQSEKWFAKLERSAPILFEQTCHEMHRRLNLLRSRIKNAA